MMRTLITRALLLAAIIAGICGPTVLRRSREPSAEIASAVPTEIPQPVTHVAPPEESVTMATRGSFLESEVDLGRVTPYSGRLVAQFAAINPGDRPVRLVKLAPDCSCAITSFSSNPLYPNEASICEVSIDPSAQVGAVDLGIAATFDDAPHHPHRLRVRFTVDNDVEIQPRSIDLGVFGAEGEARATTKLRNRSSAPLPVAIVDAPDAVIATLEPSVIVEPGGEIELVVIVPPSGEIATFEHTIQLAIGVDRLPAQVVVRGTPAAVAIESQPPRLNFGFVDVQQSIVQSRPVEFQLRSNDGQDFEVLGVTAEPMSAVASWTRTGPGDARVAVTLGAPDAGREAGIIESHVCVRVRVDGSVHSIMVPYRAYLEHSTPQQER